MNHYPAILLVVFTLHVVYHLFGVLYLIYISFLMFSHRMFKISGPQAATLNGAEQRKAQPRFC